jgi:hypothetical protein
MGNRTRTVDEKRCPSSRRICRIVGLGGLRLPTFEQFAAADQSVRFAEHGKYGGKHAGHHRLIIWVGLVWIGWNLLDDGSVELANPRRAESVFLRQVSVEREQPDADVDRRHFFCYVRRRRYD